LEVDDAFRVWEKKITNLNPNLAILIDTWEGGHA
jgi:hypothetical protein